jgi:hypothetical protein
VIKKYVVATAAAVACSGMALAAQSQAPGSTAGTAPGTTTTQAPSAQTAPAKASATFTGCIYKEKDVPSRSPNLAERVGIGEDYILAEVRPAAGSGAVGTSGSTAEDANRMYKLEFVDDAKLSAMAGKRVEVTGRIDAEAGDAKGQSAPAASQTDRVIGRDRVDLAEFEVTSIREIEGTCPATPSAK